MSTLSADAASYAWLLDNFVATVPGARHTLAVSADGLLMAMSRDLDRTNGDQMAADLDYVPLPASVKDLVKAQWMASLKDGAGKAIAWK